MHKWLDGKWDIYIGGCIGEWLNEYVDGCVDVCADD
jgi:hypothetical protein